MEIWGKTLFLTFVIVRDRFLMIEIFLGSRNYLISRPNCIRYPSHSARQQFVVAPQCSPSSQDNRLQKLWNGRLNKTFTCPTDALLTIHRVELQGLSGVWSTSLFSWIPVWFLARPISFLLTGGSCSSALGQKRMLLGRLLRDLIPSFWFLFFDLKKRWACLCSPIFLNPRG